MEARNGMGLVANDIDRRLTSHGWGPETDGCSPGCRSCDETAVDKDQRELWGKRVKLIMF